MPELFSIQDPGRHGSLPVVFTIPPRTVPTCHCGVVLTKESTGLCGTQCQECWEKEVDDSWWELCAPFWCEVPL